MILELTDFIDRPYKIPNQNESPDLESFIDLHERKLLKDLLGYELYKEFDEALEGSGALEQKWTDLKDGVEYTHNGILCKWEGLVDLLRPAVYSLWIPTCSYKFTNVGWIENNAQQQSVTLTDNTQFTVQYWNEYVDKARVNSQGNLYDFLLENETDYDNWIFKKPLYKNRFGL